MGMSTHVVGFRPPDDDWKKMKAVYDACTAAGVDPPREVSEFFEDGPPDPAGVEVKLSPREWVADGRSGYEVDVDTLPPGVKVIRFYNSW